MSHNHVASEMTFKLGTAQAGTAELLIYDIIGETFDGEGITAKQVAEQLAALTGVSVINVRINSAGGSVFHATAIYNALARHSARVEVDVDGAALSSASLVAMAGDEIRMAENAMMMIHDPLSLAFGGSDDLRKEAELLDQVKANLVSTYSARTGVKTAEVARLMGEETWFTAQEAVDKGFADSITDAKRIAAIGDLSRFQNVPTSFVGGPTASVDPKPKIHDAGIGPTITTKLETTQMSEPTKPQPATIAELQAAFPNDDKFSLECAAEGLPLIEARAAFSDHLQARLQNRDTQIKTLDAEKAQAVATAVKPARGAAPVTDDADDSTAAGDPLAIVNARVQQLVDNGLDRHRAHKRVMSSDPTLRLAYVNATCEEHGRPQLAAAS